MVAVDGGERMTYEELDGANQQAVDLWLDERIAWVDVPADAQAYLIHKAHPMSVARWRNNLARA